jgi:transposase
MDESGRTAVNRNVPNGRETVLGVIGDLPVGTPVALEAAFGWGWLIELLQDYEPHLAHPLQCKAIASARLKNDKVDAVTLAHLLRTDLLPEAWIAPALIREQRAVLRHRTQLVRLRTLVRNRNPRSPRRSRLRPRGQLLERGGPRVAGGTTSTGECPPGGRRSAGGH